MRSGLLSLLLFALCLPAHAEQSPPPAADPSTALQAQLDELSQRLALSEQQRQALAAELEAGAVERESAQVARLRQETQRLKLQLKQAQANAPDRLLSEQQTWFAIGGGASLLGVLLGALLRGKRSSRREWIN
ncbi:MAG: translation initiation factor 2 [Gammaproteobacteria bacterium]|jgi:SH3 domain protein|uniref:Translation initiation factor 2 n=1 Tax=Pseudomonas cuatrocienegasensis TaxID=543360 RepID=A0ABY1B9V7_9PSED|nr:MULTISPECIES: translation initiation factor 2 [Pseudomonas]MBU1488929.1 translation initiation factor 2 [Gammaproteobacteria bacterium]MBU2064373.1 translation initiation factor 2 [Gammaproteobacteria bacterium]MBU2138179.1 translation initiation factor 2 [Gammaproteobacteria bacterium]MBU2217932.1 translation initiation factor 2 [Gammaproteobacteria bacterium]MBU2323557.1 translation initiation factor 2 [Gammaproteobacteria bacterium]